MTTLADVSVTDGSDYNPIIYDPKILKMRRYESDEGVDMTTAQDEITRFGAMVGKLPPDKAAKLRSKLNQSQSALNAFMKSQ